MPVSEQTDLYLIYKHNGMKYAAIEAEFYDEHTDFSVHRT